MPAQQHVQAQVLPSGHTVYVNATTPQQYGGYATIHYHPQTQQHHIVHQPLPAGVIPRPSNEQQYISVVPIQGAGGHIQSVGPIQGAGGHIQSVGPGGTYTYWQPPDGQAGGPQTVAILPPGANGVPVAVSHVGKMGGPLGSPKNRQHNHQRTPPHGGRGKEKNGKGKRTNGQHQGRGSNGSDRSASASNGVTSGTSLLEEFKNKKNNRDWSIHDIKGHVVEFCQDQNGSRFVQQRLEVGDFQEKEIVMQEILPAIVQLRNDVFGNYVVQKLFDFGTDQMKHDLRDTLSGEMVPLSMQMYG
jgi:hypothetical protein